MANPSVCLSVGQPATMMTYAETTLATAAVNGLFESLFLLVLRKVSLVIKDHPNSPKF